MTAATPAPPPRDHRAELVHRKWRGWTEAQGHNWDDDSYQAEAFAAGWEAADAVVAQPAPGGSHIGRSWSGHGIEDDCPVPEGPVRARGAGDRGGDVRPASLIGAPDDTPVPPRR